MNVTASSKNTVFSAEKLHGLCRLRSTLEVLAVAELWDNPLRKHVLKALQAQMGRLKACATSGSYEAFHCEDMTFHRIVVEAGGLPTLIQCWQLVVEELDAWILSVKLEQWPSLMALYRDHEALLQAWSGDNRHAAEEATHRHLEVGWYRSEIDSGRRPEIGNVVDRAASYLSTHYATRINIGWLAANICFVSTSQLTRRFHEQFGLAPYAWLRQLRMDRAAQLLKRGKQTIAEVAKRVGYRNTSNFTRDFREHFGVTPRRYLQAD